MEVSGQLHTPAALPPGKDPLYPLDRRLGGPQSRSGRGVLEKNSQPPPGIEPLSIRPILILPFHLLVSPPVRSVSSATVETVRQPQSVWVEEKLGPHFLEVCAYRGSDLNVEQGNTTMCIVEGRLALFNSVKWRVKKSGKQRKAAATCWVDRWLVLLNFQVAKWLASKLSSSFNYWSVVCYFPLTQDFSKSSAVLCNSYSPEAHNPRRCVKRKCKGLTMKLLPWYAAPLCTSRYGEFDVQIEFLSRFYVVLWARESRK
jgi:hypothetical protein